MQEEKPDFEKIAAQLARPSGEMGIEVGNRMNESNGEMTRHAIDLLKIREGEVVFELGPGNARFAGYVLEKAQRVQYIGGDISETMVEEAKRINQTYLEKGVATFHVLDGTGLPFESQSFDKVFTVNTLYFWHEPLKTLEELHRVLRPGGLLCIAIRSKSFMLTLPFSKYGFTLYSPEEGLALFEKSSFREITYTLASVEGEIFTGEPVTKEEVFFMLRKAG